MANEIKITHKITTINGVFKNIFQPDLLQVTQSTVGASSGVITVGTAEEDLTPTDISTNGWLILHNLDNTNYVTYGPKSGGSMVAFGKLKPGEHVSLRLAPTVIIRWQANTSAVKVYYQLLED